MNSVIKPKTKKVPKPKYPCLMIEKDRGIIILAVSSVYATIVHPGESLYSLGTIYSPRSMEMDIFDGEITLSN